VSPLVKTRHRLRNRCHHSTNTTPHRCQPQHHNTSPPPRQNTSLTTLTCAIHSPLQHRLPLQHCQHRAHTGAFTNSTLRRHQCLPHHPHNQQPVHYHHSLHHPARHLTAHPQHHTRETTTPPR